MCLSETSQLAAFSLQMHLNPMMWGTMVGEGTDADWQYPFCSEQPTNFAITARSCQSALLAVLSDFDCEGTAEGAKKFFARRLALQTLCCRFYLSGKVYGV